MNLSGVCITEEERGMSNYKNFWKRRDMFCTVPECSLQSDMVFVTNFTITGHKLKPQL